MTHEQKETINQEAETNKNNHPETLELKKTKPESTNSLEELNNKPDWAEERISKLGGGLSKLPRQKNKKKYESKEK